MNKYEIAEKIVRKGESNVFKNWNTRGVSIEDFLDGLKWLYEDPMEDFGDGRVRMTRELGCTSDGELVKLKRVHNKNGEFVGFYRIDTDLLWNGHVSISCRDRI